MNAIFVAGTDTGVGKTVVTGLLARHLAMRGYRVVTQKWIQTGPASDLDEHLKWMGRTRADFRGFLRAMAPYSLPAPVSPHLAAELSGHFDLAHGRPEQRRMGGTRILASKVRRSLEFLSEHFDFVLVEGSGGLMTPVSRKTLLIDWVREYGLPVLLVAGNRLGAINHTLLSLEALQTRKMRILGVLFNESARRSAHDNLSRGRKDAVLMDNPKAVRGLSGQCVLGVLPWMERPAALQKRFTRVGAKVLAAYERVD